MDRSGAPKETDIWDTKPDQWIGGCVYFDPLVEFAIKQGIGAFRHLGDSVGFRELPLDSGIYRTRGGRWVGGGGTGGDKWDTKPHHARGKWIY